MGRFAPTNLDLDGKVILVTGGTGSFGRRFVETVLARVQPRKLIVYLPRRAEAERDAGRPGRALRAASRWPTMRFFLGDVRDRERLILAMPRASTSSSTPRR